MSVLQLNRVASLPRLLSPKSGGGGSGTRRTSASFAISNIGGLPSCPALSTAITPEREPGISKRGRVSSAPFMRRKGDPPGHREAHGSHCHNLHSSRPAPLQGALFGKPFSTTPYKQSTQDRVGFGGISFTLSSSPHCEVEQGMPKAPQLSFRSPVSQPKMVAFQPDLYAPMAKPASSPKISYSSMLGPLNGAASLHSPEVAAIAAVLEPHRRSPAPESRPMLRLVRSTEDEHVLSVRLPGFAPEMVTICVRREDKLAVVADLWHAESNCHHEWLVAFSSRDANVLQTRAQFSADGTLTIHVPRHHGYSPRMRSRLR